MVQSLKVDQGECSGEASIVEECGVVQGHRIVLGRARAASRPGTTGALQAVCVVIGDSLTLRRVRGSREAIAGLAYVLAAGSGCELVGALLRAERARLHRHLIGHDPLHRVDTGYVCFSRRVSWTGREMGTVGS